MNPDILADLVEKKKIFKLKHQLYYVLAFDEIYVRKNLVFDKRTGELVGFVKLDELEEELTALNRELHDELSGVVVNTTKPQRKPVDKMLCFLLTGICNNLKAVVACYPRASTSKEKLHGIVWEVVSTLERNGFHINCVVCDGASVNRGFIQMHEPITKTASGVVFDTINPWSGKPLYFMSDPPHLLKTTRNGLYSSGRLSRGKGKGCIRSLQKGGQQMLWSTIVGLYEEEKDFNLRKLYKLNSEDIFINSYSAMRVSLAAHVLSRSLAEAISKKFKGKFSQFSKFLDIMNDFFDMTNGQHSFQAARSRIENFKSYSDVNDARFAKMEEMWQFFEEWKSETKALNLTANEKAKRLLSAETLQGLERTMKGFTAAVKYVLTEGKDEEEKPYINARVYSQDPLENYFSSMRAKFGGNRHPDSTQVLQGQVSLHVQKDWAFRSRKRSNCADSGTRFSIKDLNAPLPKRPKARRRLETA